MRKPFVVFAPLLRGVRTEEHREERSAKKMQADATAQKRCLTPAMDQQRVEKYGVTRLHCKVAVKCERGERTSEKSFPDIQKVARDTRSCIEQ